MGKELSGKSLLCGSTGKSGVWRCSLGGEGFKTGTLILKGNMYVTLEKTNTILFSGKAPYSQIECRVNASTARCNVRGRKR